MLRGSLPQTQGQLTVVERTALQAVIGSDVSSVIPADKECDDTEYCRLLWRIRDVGS
jgi:hypothetical protein